jgi:hypothetical protein
MEAWGIVRHMLFYEVNAGQPQTNIVTQNTLGTTINYFGDNSVQKKKNLHAN